MDRLLVISSCTADKAVSRRDGLTLRHFQNLSERRGREEALKPFARPAAALYTGMQHRHLMRGIDRLRRRYGRETVELKIISAGYGLVDENRLLVPYEATFEEMSRTEARAWARALGIAAAVRESLTGRTLVVVLLGARYLEAIEPPLRPETAQRIVFLARADMRERLDAPGVTVVPVGKVEAARYHAGHVALKGRMFDLFAAGLAAEPSLWRAVHEDRSGRAFIRTVERGAAVQ